MPLFEYRCDKCGKRFTFLVGMTADKSKPSCPKCAGRKVTKLISRIARVGRSKDDFDGDMDMTGENLDDEGGEDEDLDGLDDE
jgi:putative FmdB family regulatory protein